MLLYLSLFIPLILLLSIVYWSIRNGISPTPSSRRQMEAILRAIPPDWNGTAYDLGSGWGTLAFALARRFPDRRIVAVENSHVPFAVSRFLHFINGPKNLTFQFGDMITLPLVEAGVIVCYLYPGGMRKLLPVFERLNPGTLILSNTFAIPGWKPMQVFAASDVYRSPIYVYQVAEEQ